jgi:hypothetical protein
MGDGWVYVSVYDANCMHRLHASQPPLFTNALTFRALRSTLLEGIRIDLRESLGYFVLVGVWRYASHSLPESMRVKPKKKKKKIIITIIASSSFGLVSYHKDAQS